MPLAKEIVVDRDENGAPRITIDGFVVPWWMLEGSIKVPAPSRKEMPSITVTFLADKVTMVNDDRIVRNLGDAQIAKLLEVDQFRPATLAEQLEMPTWSPFVRVDDASEQPPDGG